MQTKFWTPPNAKLAIGTAREKRVKTPTLPVLAACIAALSLAAVVAGNWFASRQLAAAAHEAAQVLGFDESLQRAYQAENITRAGALGFPARQFYLERFDTTSVGKPQLNAWLKDEYRKELAVQRKMLEPASEYMSRYLQEHEHVDAKRAKNFAQARREAVAIREAAQIVSERVAKHQRALQAELVTAERERLAKLNVAPGSSAAVIKEQIEACLSALTPEQDTPARLAQLTPPSPCEALAVRAMTVATILFSRTPLDRRILRQSTSSGYLYISPELQHSYIQSAVNTANFVAAFEDRLPLTSRFSQASIQHAIFNADPADLAKISNTSRLALTHDPYLTFKRALWHKMSVRFTINTTGESYTIDSEGVSID